MNCETDQIRIHVNVWNFVLFYFFELALIPHHSKSNYKCNVMVRSVLTSLCIMKQFICESSISTTHEFS